MRSSSRLVLLSSLFFLLANIHFLSAQAYNTALGIRIGDGIGFTAKQRITERGGLEAIFQGSRRNDEVRITGLWEEHRKILMRNLSIYFGGGLHKGFYDRQEILVKDPFGITAIAGLELTFGRFNVSYDFKPVVNLSGGFNVFESQTGLSLRYVIDKRPMGKKNKEGGGIFGNGKSGKSGKSSSKSSYSKKRRSTKV